MDRQIVYPGQIPLETDLLNTNKYAMIALAKLSAAMLGTATIVNGLGCVPTGPASLQVGLTRLAIPTRQARSTPSRRIASRRLRRRCAATCTRSVPRPVARSIACRRPTTPFHSGCSGSWARPVVAARRFASPLPNLESGVSTNRNVASKSTKAVMMPSGKPTEIPMALSQ